MNNHSLFAGSKIVLTNWSEADAEAEARWSEDPAFLALIQTAPARPLSAIQIRKKARPAEESQESFVFSVRELESGRVVGSVALRYIQWNHGLGWLTLAIGDSMERRRGFGSEALALLTRYTFHELNLQRILASAFEYNIPARAFLEKYGFTLQVQQREALLRSGRRWDRLIYELERSDWEAALRSVEEHE
jgi:RimJ/RimL family protein N-acetyltransferase